jgi:hypothetical protein
MWDTTYFETVFSLAVLDQSYTSLVVYSLKLQIIKSNIRTIQLFFATIVKTQNIKYNVIIHVPQQPDPFAKTVLLELNSILVFQSYLTCIQIINW